MMRAIIVYIDTVLAVNRQALESTWMLLQYDFSFKMEGLAKGGGCGAVRPTENEQQSSASQQPRVVAGTGAGKNIVSFTLSVCM